MSEPHTFLNAQSEAEARASLTRCCGSTRWVEGMLEARPFASSEALHEAAERVWSELDEDDYLEAFSHHPRIGEDLAALRERFPATDDALAWAGQEQAGVRSADEATLRSLAEANRLYLARFGFIFIICATGLDAVQMLEAVEQRATNTRAQELVHAIGEQAKITRLRLEKLAP